MRLLRPNLAQLPAPMRQVRSFMVRYQKAQPL
jgi:hypothetical protein